MESSFNMCKQKNMINLIGGTSSCFKHDTMFLRIGHRSATIFYIFFTFFFALNPVFNKRVIPFQRCDCFFHFQPIAQNSNQLRAPGMLENFSLVLSSKIEFCSMTLYDTCFGFVTLETDETDNVLMRLLNVVETLNQHNQVNFSCVSSCEKLISCIFMINS